MDEVLEPSNDTVPLDMLTKVYIKMRDKRAQMKREFEAKDLEIEEQMQQIETLMMTCTYDEQRKRGINWQMANGMTQGDAYKTIQELRENQLDPVTHGVAYNQGDITEHVKKVL